MLSAGCTGCCAAVGEAGCATGGESTLSGLLGDDMACIKLIKGIGTVRWGLSPFSGNYETCITRQEKGLHTQGKGEMARKPNLMGEKRVVPQSLSLTLSSDYYPSPLTFLSLLRGRKQAIPLMQRSALSAAFIKTPNYELLTKLQLVSWLFLLRNPP